MADTLDDQSGVWRFQKMIEPYRLAHPPRWTMATSGKQKYDPWCKCVDYSPSLRIIGGTARTWRKYLATIRTARLRKRPKRSQKGQKRYRGKGIPPLPALVFFIPRWPNHMPEQAHGVQRGCNYPGENLVGLKLAYERRFKDALRLHDSQIYDAIKDWHESPKIEMTLQQRRESLLDYLKAYEFDIIRLLARQLDDADRSESCV